MIIFILLVIVCIFCFSLIKNQDKMKREALLEYELSALLDEYCHDFNFNILSCDKPLMVEQIIRSITKNGEYPMDFSSSDHDFKKIIAERLVNHIEKFHYLDCIHNTRSMILNIYSAAINYLIKNQYLDEHEANDRRNNFTVYMAKHFGEYI